MTNEELGSPLRWILATRTRTWVAAALAWSILGFLSAAHWQLFFLGGSPYTWWQLLRIKLVLWYLWGAATFLIVWVGRRYRPEGPRWKSRALALLAFSFIIVTAYLAVYTIAIWWHLIWMGAGRDLPYLFGFVLDHHSTFYYLAFWATLGVEYAFYYAQRSKDRELLASQLEAQLSEARLHDLQARMQPHFLFNALNTIASLVHDKRSEEAYDVLTRLSEFLRESLKQGRTHQIPLCRELEFVSHYVGIVRARYPDRLSFRLEYDGTFDSQPVPTLILQPLVENAVVHGLAGQNSRLELVVACRRENGGILLGVEDNGPGLPTDFDIVSSEGFGLASTRARIQSLYGGRAQFSLTHRNPTGAVARLTLPASSEAQVTSA